MNTLDRCPNTIPFHFMDLPVLPSPQPLPRYVAVQMTHSALAWAIKRPNGELVKQHLTKTEAIELTALFNYEFVRAQ